jgi:hypothetical protein
MTLGVRLREVAGARDGRVAAVGRAGTVRVAAPDLGCSVQQGTARVDQLGKTKE